MINKKKTLKKRNKAVKKTKTLLIVESPTKAVTISKYLKSTYKVISSMGHVMDLPKSRLGIDLEENFEPDYIAIKKASKIIKTIKEEAAKAKLIYLASDNDREGEAIAWGIDKILSLKFKENKPEVKRIVFNEITPEAIQNSILNPSELNYNKVNAQKARRVLDRLVGYHLSPLLWKKVKSGLSAGRVQSASLKLLCDRHIEIENFKPQEYWEIEADFTASAKKTTDEKIVSLLIRYKNESHFHIANQEEVQAALKAIKSQKYSISKLINKQTKRKAPAPLITSSLQQEAVNKLNFSVDKTMRVAQSLYEGVKLEKGSIGLITYMRTDSLRASQGSLNELRSYIKESIGKEYLSDKLIHYKNTKKVQDAHECIRPTFVNKIPSSLEPYLNRDQLKLYTLIWNRFVASQMSAAVYDSIQVTIESEDKEIAFRSNASKIIFFGFMKILQEKQTKKEELENLKNFDLLSKMQKTNPVFLQDTREKQLFTKAPPYYTEASLVKTLESSGIGRPGTYSPTIQTLLKRTYIYRDKKRLDTTELGLLINDLISEFFPNITDSHFTANMESFLDEIEENQLVWNSVIKEFFNDFKIKLQKAELEMKNLKDSFKKETDIPCQKCGNKMLIRKAFGRGDFLGCSQFPSCRHTESIHYGNCPQKTCSGKIIQKKAKSRLFFGCSAYPECRFASWDNAIQGSSCPTCESVLFYKKNRDKPICLSENCQTLKKG